MVIDCPFITRIFHCTIWYYKIGKRFVHLIKISEWYRNRTLWEAADLVDLSEERLKIQTKYVQVGADLTLKNFRSYYWLSDQKRFHTPSSEKSGKAIRYHFARTECYQKWYMNSNFRVEQLSESISMPLYINLQFYKLYSSPPRNFSEIKLLPCVEREKLICSVNMSRP